MNEQGLPPKVSVIIPVKDMAGALRVCLEALQDQAGVTYGQEYEVIVVDDGSTDASAAIATAAGVRVHSQKNAGAAAARNAGAKMALGGLLAFTDADCVPARNWVANIMRAFEKSELVGVKGVYTTQQTEGVARFVQQEYAHKYHRMARLSRIDFIDTYSAAYRKDIFLENGGFDERFPKSSVEDQEFSFRLATKGYLLEFHPELVVSHTHDRTLAEYARRKFWIGFWKTELLRWLPEKSFSDSHTPPSQRLQILLLGFILLFALVGCILLPALWLAAAALLSFFITALPFMRWIMRYDAGITGVAPALILTRAAALGAGLAAGILVPPRQASSKRIGWLNHTLKRALDLVGASLGLILTSPVVLLSALAIKLEDGGTVFFCQERIGENGRSFRLVKLRTMAPGSEERVHEVLPKNGLRGPAFKIPDDPRITGVGGVLRRWSLDELPQFWNVLKGEMSLVGPRPEETWIVNCYTDFQRLRLVVKPGMTGPMQVNGRGNLDFEERLRLELEYITHYSIWLDVRILARTIPVVIKGEGAY
jgi:lipopolysaccharide/colanic/teichoic acid biosynthesis glycosyltransferase/glycosyltransferase involved in cell wall biosynthesis